MNGLVGQLAARRPQVALPSRLPMDWAFPMIGLVGQLAAWRPQVALLGVGASKAEDHENGRHVHRNGEIFFNFRIVVVCETNAWNVLQDFQKDFQKEFLLS